VQRGQTSRRIRVGSGSRANSFQAGHANSILVTRSTAKALVNGAIVPPTPRARCEIRASRAINGPLAVTAASDPLVNRSRNLSIPLAGCVLINQRGAHTRVPHSMHQLPGAPPRGGRQRVPCVAQIVEPEALRQSASATHFAQRTDRWKLFRRNAAPSAPSRSGSPDRSVGTRPRARVPLPPALRVRPPCGDRHLTSACPNPLAVLQFSELSHALLQCQDQHLGHGEPPAHHSAGR